MFGRKKPAAAQLPAYISLRYDPNGCVSAFAAPLSGKTVADVCVGILRTCWRLPIVLTKAACKLVHKIGVDGPLRMQLGNEKCDGLRCPDAQPRKRLRMRIAIFFHVAVLHARCDKQHGTAGGVACKRDVAGSAATSEAA